MEWKVICRLVIFFYFAVHLRLLGTSSARDEFWTISW